MKDRNKIMRFFGLHPQNDVRGRFAFTLAEVLVTLGIIGVVAVLTVPNVISSYQKKVYVTQLQKGYSQLQQVFDLAMADNEDDEGWKYLKEDVLPRILNEAKEHSRTPKLDRAFIEGAVSALNAARVLRDVRKQL